MMGLRVLLALAYPVFAHLASARSDGGWAALALADIVLLLLLEPLLKRRLWALSLLGMCLLALWVVSQSRYALMPLLAPPVVFIALVAWLFGRTLYAGRVPLITRIVEGLYAQASMPVSPALYLYTRQLTVAWAAMLAVLAVLNLLLALCAVPSGVLHQFGHTPVLAVTDEQWSLFANVLNYGIVGGFFVVEYWLRKRRFPHRPYRNVGEFIQQMARLGPRFWNELMR
ncbi:ketosynthase [Pseudoxanthomonas sp. CF125]|uniref:ketosynthase n=1 Tax=Pseudoxanthomonas sp. CF125 TaxID=1855303 RepID=UPI0015A01D39|nr:ketosynthase [Pseudoxanthomonas sp. CF125]